MQYSLESFPSIPPKAREILTQNGLHTTDDLLQRLALPHQREEFARQTDLALEELTRWAGMADLVRVKGIGPTGAQLMVLSGQAGSIQEFIHHFVPQWSVEERSRTGLQELSAWLKLFKTNGAKLFQHRFFPLTARQKKIESILPPRPADRESIQQCAKGLRSRLVSAPVRLSTPVLIPSVRQLSEMAEEAFELRPRLVLLRPDDGQKFQAEVQKETWKKTKVLIKYSLVGWALVLLITIMILWDLSNKFRNVMDSYLDSPFLVLRLHKALVQGAVESVWQNMVVLFLLIMAAGFLALGVFALLYYVVAFYSAIGLMNRPIHRSFFLKSNQISLKKEERVGQIGLTILFLLSLALVLYSFRHQILWNSNTPFPFSQYAAVAGICLGLIASSASLSHMIVGIKVYWAREHESVRRYLLHMFAQVILYPLVCIGGAFALVVAVDLLYHHISQQYLVPAYRTKLENICRVQALAEAGGNIDDPSYDLSMDLCINEISIVRSRFDSAVLGTSVDLGVLRENESFLHWATNNLMIWMFLAGMALLFVVPYLSLGGWWRGLFYIFLLILAARIENVLSTNFAGWLNLEPGMFGTVLIIGFLILSSALLLDWAYDTLTENTKNCPNCQTLIEDYVYCPICGLAQS